MLTVALFKEQKAQIAHSRSFLKINDSEKSIDGEIERANSQPCYFVCLRAVQNVYSGVSTR